jgi:hypothetical protein
MKLAIVHLSDLHLGSRSDVGFKRREKLGNRIQFSRSPEEKLLFIVTGDIANAGSLEEYRVAEDFFRPLFLQLGVNSSDSPSPTIFIPGNHDCNFKDIGDLRPRLLSEIGGQLESLDGAGETARTLLQVHSDFFAFQERLSGEHLGPEKQLYFTKKFAFDELSVEFRCFNSAWLSQRHEAPGSLGFPPSVISASSAKSDSDVVISMVHHPANWMGPAAYQQFRRAVQESSDFLFTGHEHNVGGQVISPFGGSQLIHFESGPYQPANSGDSDFGILHIDLSKRLWRQESFTWHSGFYIKAGEVASPKPLDKFERASGLQLTPKFLARLIEPGTGFLHPRQQHLTLPDIYIYPDLRTRIISGKLRRTDDLPKEIQSQQAAQRILGASQVVIAGPTDSGKTALSKMLFLDGNTRYNRSCLLLYGKELNGKNPETSFQSAIEGAIEEQYGNGAAGPYAGLSARDRVLIIDDWDSTGFNRAGRQAILTRAVAQFASVILFADDIFLIEELSGRYEHAPLANFEILDIREFGFRLRGDMARKWHRLGSDFVANEQTFARHVADSIRVIDTAMGRNLLPSYPVNILTLLQTYDAGAGVQNTGLGSYGQVYEALITARLARVSVKSIDIGTKITFLSQVAWHLFNSRQSTLSEAEWISIRDQYFDTYWIRINAEELKTRCVEAGLITEIESGYRFSHGYAYCYFTAKYFQENLADLADDAARQALFDKLKSLSERVYNENNANIVIFYVFLTKDRALISHVLTNAKKIFGETVEFDFDSHVKFVNSLIEPLAPVQLPDGRPEQNQQAYDQKRDEAGEQIEPRGNPDYGDVLYSPDLPLEQKLVIGVRYLTLMGQILRNFPGSLKADTKLDLAFESYSLGLRILSPLFALAERDSEKLIKEVSDVLRTRLAFAGTERELKDRAELIIAELLRGVTYGLLKRISHAVGLRELEATYDEVATLRGNSISTQMIQLSIRLDHFERFPKREIDTLSELLHKNTFGYQTLRDLVLNHFYLFPRDFEIQQWAGSTLNMKVNLPEVRGNAKKLRLAKPDE